MAGELCKVFELRAVLFKVFNHSAKLPRQRFQRNMAGAERLAPAALFLRKSLGQSANIVR